jgi:RimJ/RimL family protein N-acetyltransferase
LLEDVKVLITPRLVLRPIRVRDGAALRAHWDRPEIRRYLFDRVAVTPELVAEIVQDSEADFAKYGYGLWAMLNGAPDSEPGSGPDTRTGNGPGGEPSTHSGNGPSTRLGSRLSSGPGTRLDGETYGERILGVCGLRAADDGRIEMLYSLDPLLWGLGLATEAAKAVLVHATALGLAEVVAEADTGNAASVRLAIRLGMRRLDTRDNDTLVRFITP